MLYNAIVVAKGNPKTIITLVIVYFMCLGVEVISKFDRKQRNILLWCVVGLTVLQGILIVVQFFDLDPFFKALSTERFYRTVGLSGSRNQVGLFFSVVSPVILSISPILFPIVIFGLFCSSTVSAWGGMVAGCLVYSYYRSKQVFKITLLLLICTVLFFMFFEQTSLTAYKERFNLYKHTIQSVEGGYVVLKKKHNDVTMVKEITCNKWFGYGLSSFSTISPYTQHVFLNKKGVHAEQHVYSHAHNDLLEIFFELGRIGFGLVLLLILKTVWDFLKARKTKILIISFSCLVAQIVSAQGIFTVHTAVGGMFLVLFYGIFCSEIRRIENV